MTPAQIRKLADVLCPRDIDIACDALRACADVVEAARKEESHTGRECETVRCQICEALARLEALKL